MRNWDVKPVRIPIDLTADERDELDRLKAVMKTRTRARLIRQALRFYGVLADLKQKGYLIQAVRQGSLLQFPELDVPYPQEIPLKKKPV
jgi:ribbon-helix-helix CopG family protein